MILKVADFIGLQIKASILLRKVENLPEIKLIAKITESNSLKASLPIADNVRGE
jgi:hypothetical protein